MAPALTELKSGSVIGHHRILETLGRGTMAFVYRALSPSGEEVALKVMFAEDARNPAVVERFRREAAAAARIAHPHVARGYGSGEENGVLFLVMELVRGRSLAERLKNGGKLEPREAARIGAEIAQALAAVHAAGFVHRDLKPENVLLDETGGAKVTDLGVARRTIGGNSLTHTGELVGTPEYMAPEQAQGARSVDSRADLYSLGLLIHALIAGAPPFVGTAFSVVTQQLTVTPPRLRTLVPTTPAALESLVVALTAKDPQARPDDAGAIGLQLQAIAHGGGGSRRRDLWLGVAFAVVACLALAFLIRAILVARSGAAPLVRHEPTVLGPTPPPEAFKTPPWYGTLDPSLRPPLPLPPTLAFGAAAGEYVAARDATVVVVYVPPGSFCLGNAPEKMEVRLSGYFMGKNEITNAQFRRYAKDLALVAPDARDRDHPASRPLSWEHPWVEPDAPPIADEEPVVVVTPDQAVAYAAALGLALPSEVQWERAAAWDGKAGTGVRYAWGETDPEKARSALANLPDRAFARLYPNAPVVRGYDDGYARLAPVGQFPDDRSQVGCFDMTGNVSEICVDFWSTSYLESSRDRLDPVQATPGATRARVIRGGSWAAIDKQGLLARTRCDVASNTVGFRVALGIGKLP